MGALIEGCSTFGISTPHGTQANLHAHTMFESMQPQGILLPNKNSLLALPTLIAVRSIL